GLALTKLDVLTGLDALEVCVAYDTPAGRTREFPIDELDRATPVYETLPGWREALGDARSLDALPASTRAYIDFVVREVGCPVSRVSVGSGREQTIVLRDPFLAPPPGTLGR